MVDIFISYASVDRPSARRLADALESCGWSVWWDHSNLHGGEQFDGVIEKAICGARVVIVVWSKASVESGWVRDEAMLALEEHKLVPLRIDMTHLPMRFRNIHTIDLVSWIRETEAEPFERLVKDLGHYLGPANSSNRSDDSGISTVSGKQVPSLPKVENQSLLDQDENNIILPSSTGTTAIGKVRKVMAAVGFDAESDTEREFEELKKATSKLLAGLFTLSDEVHPGEFSLVFRDHFYNDEDQKVAVKVLRRNPQISNISIALYSALLKAKNQAERHPSLIDIMFFLGKLSFAA